MPSVDDCSRTAPPPAPSGGGWNASGSLAGFRRTHRLVCVGIRSLVRQVTALANLAGCSSANVVIAVSAVARFGAFQTSRKSDLAAGWTNLGSLSGMLAVLSTVQH